ncbi:uncharacterized protein LOC130430729 isoform X3 [Triplophysa dalaica]|uniref:uncharacterized protein LOC130430729 isoform X3 n=1 Tax=Triplophysa dalaica TaxID=1582913 RepID=UPI0024DF7DEE|nr:uncharacterized protein LOC130430729 isoform X3 [Triplophysa dalaica]
MHLSASGVYYCMKKDGPPKFSNGTRLQINETTENPNEEIRYKHQNHTEVKYIQQNQTLWQTLTLILGLLNGVLFIVVIGLLKAFIDGNKTIEEGFIKLPNTYLQQVTYRSFSNLKPAKVTFDSCIESCSRKSNHNCAASKLPT